MGHIDYSGNAVTLTDAATVAVDCEKGNTFKLSTSNSRTMGAPSNIRAGQWYTILISNSGASTIQPVWNAAYNLKDTLCLVAPGQTEAFTFYADPSGNLFEQSRVFGSAIDVRRFGAKCDDTTD